QRDAQYAVLHGGVGESLRDRRRRHHALPRGVADPVGAGGAPGAAQPAPARALLRQVVRLRAARHLAALDAAAHPRGSDDGAVLVVAGCAGVGELRGGGGVGGRVSRGSAGGALGAVRGGGGRSGRVPAPRRLPRAQRTPRAPAPELQPALDRALAGVIAMGLGTYLRNIKDAVATIADGMAVTAAALIRTP